MSVSLCTNLYLANVRVIGSSDNTINIASVYFLNIHIRVAVRLEWSDHNNVFYIELLASRKYI